METPKSYFIMKFLPGLILMYSGMVFPVLMLADYAGLIGHSVNNAHLHLIGPPACFLFLVLGAVVCTNILDDPYLDGQGQ